MLWSSGFPTYGHSNARALDAFDDEAPAVPMLARDPDARRDAGHRSIPHSPEWTTRVNTLHQQIKAGFRHGAGRPRPWR